MSSGLLAIRAWRETRDRFVQLSPLGGLQRVVQISLKEDVPKPKVGEMRLAHFADVHRRHEMVLPVQRTAKFTQQCLHIFAQHIRDDLRRELLALDARDIEGHPLCGRQPVDAAADD